MNRDLVTVYRKELRETLRDRRTLFVMILLPLVLYPLLTILTSEWVISHQARRRASRSKIVVAGALDEAGPLLDAMADPKALLDLDRRPGPPPAPPTTTAALDGKDVLVVIPAGFSAALSGGQSPEVKVYHDASDDDSKQALDRVKDVAGRFAQAERVRRLGERGLPPTFLEPVPLSSVNLASKAKLGRTEASKTLPLIIVMMTLMGSFYPAIDLTAGEKERGTLEALLATPASRRTIVAGKFLTVATVSFITGLLNVLCIGVAILWIVRSALRASGQGFSFASVAAAIPWDAVALGLVALAGAAAMFSALMMAIASLARTFKEAQNFIAPVQFAATLPAMLAFLPGTELNAGTALVPIANVVLLLKEAIAGTLQVLPALVALAAMIAYGALAIAFAVRIYDSERLLFAPDTPPGGKRGWRGMLAALREGRAAARPAGAAGGVAGAVAIGAAEAVATYGVVFLLFFFVAPDLQARGIWGLTAAQWLLVALPVVLLARARGPLVPTLALARPPPRVLLGAALIGAGAWYVSLGIGALQQRVAPVPAEVERALSDLVGGVSTPALLIAFAFTPAVCEELLCRGVLARSLRASLGTTGAVVASAALFALLHMSAHRFVPQFLLGLSLGAITLAARSLWPAILVHLLHNAGLLLAAAPAMTHADPRLLAPVAVAAVIAGHFLILRRPLASE